MGTDPRTVVFAGESEMAARSRDKDWSATPLGAVQEWPQSLRMAAQMTIASLFPAIVLWGPQLVQIYNDGYRDVMGVKHPGGLGQPTSECWPEAWHINAPIYERVRAGETLSFEHAHIPLARGGGALEDAWFTLSYAPLRDERGAVGGVLVTLLETTKELTARALEAEREVLLSQISVERNRLAEIFRMAPSFLAVLRGPTHIFEFANDAYYSLIGHREIIGKAVDEAVPEAREQGFIELLDSVFTTGESFVGRELPIMLQRFPGAPLEQRYLDFVYQALVEADGSRSGIVAHGSDVTAQVLARQEVERLYSLEQQARGAAEDAYRAAEAANRAKSEFLAVMSHELRTPLNAIGGYAELIALGIRGPVTDAQREDLRRLQTSQRHLLGLINEVLNYAKLETGSVHYDIEDVAVRDALSAAEALVSPQARARQIVLTVDECPPWITARADAEKLRQVLVNLLSNAVKFTPPGGRIGLECTADAERVTIRVRDTGIGIAADQIERIFEPFVQVRADLTRTAEGTGLGLAISRDLARGMHGDLTAESSLGAGSTFTLTLPVRPTAPPSPASP